MTTLNLIRDFGFFVAGGAFVWFGKSTIQKVFIGANALSAKLHAEADALRAKF